MAEGNHLRLQGEITSGIRLRFKETELQRICDNNISNAIKYAFEESTVVVRLFSDLQKGVVLEVESVGEPIQEPEKLFERYYREHRSRGGFGIGLHIVKDICQKYGVQTEVISENGVNIFRYIFKDIHENTVA